MIREWTKGGVAAVFACLLAGAVQAQAMSVSPGLLQAGQTATVNYSNPSLANQDVVIEVSGGFPFSVEKVTIHLDAQGEGSGLWMVNGNWIGAAFNAPGVREIVRAIS